jgi:DNA-binding MarR family transcriptional regulator
MSIDLAPCASCNCLAFRRAARAVTRLYEGKLRPHGLRATQFSVLAMLALRGVTPMLQLAGFLGVERTTLTRSIAILEKKRWVTVEESKDARERPVRITDSGRRKVEAAFPAWKAAQELAQRKLGAEGATALHRLAAT